MAQGLWGLLLSGQCAGLMRALRQTVAPVRQAAEVSAEQVARLQCMYRYVQTAADRRQLDDEVEALQALMGGG